MNIVRQRIRNNFILSLMASGCKRATPYYRPYNKRAWWDNFVNKVVVPEEWRENFRMTRKPGERMFKAR